MAELGTTGDPGALVPGRPEAVRATAAQWRRYGDALLQAGTGLSRIDTSEGWSGPSGDAFRARFTGQPAAWLTAGDSFHDAATALDRYVVVLEWAQGRAGQIAADWDRAKAATQQAVAQHDQAQRVAGQALPFTDPGAALRQESQESLAAAHDQVRAAGDTAMGAVGVARDKAPSEPSFWSNLLDDVGAGIANGTATAVNALASYGNAVLNNPLEAGTVLAGAALMAVGGGGEVGGALLDLTGVGALGGVPLGIVSAGIIATGGAMVAGGAAALGQHALGEDQVTVMRADSTGAGDAEPEFDHTPGFRGSDYTKDEYVEFINGHTGDRNPALPRPSRQEVEDALDKGKVTQEGNGREKFVYKDVTVYVNHNMPWRSSAWK